jgi:hypothetical protein
VGPAHPGHCRGCGPLSPVGRSGGGSTGRPRSCVDEQERIMNGGAATAFLPNFAAFPSLRGLNSSPVQPWRTPRPYGVRRCAGAPTGRAARRALRVGARGPVPGADPAEPDAVPPAGAQLPRVSCLHRIRRPLLPRRTTRLRRTSRHRRSGPSGVRPRTSRPRRRPTSCWCLPRCRRPRRCRAGAPPCRSSSAPGGTCAAPPRTP